MNWPHCSSPLFVRLVLVCAVPASFLVDIMISDSVWSALKFAGCSLVVAGFAAFVQAEASLAAANTGPAETRMDSASYSTNVAADDPAASKPSDPT